MGIEPMTKPEVAPQEVEIVPLSYPTTYVRLGIGRSEKNPLFPACAPKGVNHRDFYNECGKPVCYFLAKDYGHNDMLDDETKGIRGKATYCLCTKEKSRVPMRKFVGGVLVAFLKAYLEGNSSNLVAIRDGNVTLPVELQDIDFLVQVLG
ncbi:Chlorophyllase-2, chloroplastic [Capsicum annuum]|uniref:Chlorophyllase-2, chloroplastic n=1 Tax=Capsicum annuum TaxID=4072 RepID=A0A2G2Z9K5_CAPAN|nr:Chlorophyllase-2, chloroplastic [Capsicum annuum]